MLSENLSNLEDDTSEVVSTLEALGDIADTVETIILSLGGAQERDAYLALADEYEAYAGTLPEEPALRSPEQGAWLLELEKLTEAAFKAMLQACPGHIRKLHGAVLAAVDAEEASKV